MAAIKLSKEQAALLRSCMVRENSRYLKGNERFPFHRVLCYNRELWTANGRNAVMMKVNFDQDALCQLKGTTLVVDEDQTQQWAAVGGKSMKWWWDRLLSMEDGLRARLTIKRRHISALQLQVALHKIGATVDFVAAASLFRALDGFSSRWTFYTSEHEYSPVWLINWAGNMHAVISQYDYEAVERSLVLSSNNTGNPSLPIYLPPSSGNTPPQ